MTLTVYSESQYEVQNDRPWCGYSRPFWSLVTGTVCAASFILAHWATAKSSLMTLALFPYKQPSSHSGATLSMLCWHLADWSTMVPLPWSCHSIPSPIHLGLECLMFSIETLIQMKAAMDNARFVCRNNACWGLGDEFQRSEANGKH